MLEILQLEIDPERICSEVPHRVQEDASFVIDTSKLLKRENYLSDGTMGYRNHGHGGKIFKVKDSQIVSERTYERKKNKRAKLETDEFLVKVVYWPHKKYSDFKKRSYEVESSRGENVLVLVQYIFEGDNHQVSPSKDVKISAGTRFKIQQQVTTNKTPSAIFDDLFVDAGGLNFKSPADLPKSISQIKYERNKLRKKSKVDDLATLLDLAKEKAYGIKNLQWTPYPRFVVADEEVVNDVVENCTDPAMFGPFMMDTTFNVGQFYVTTTCYTNHSVIDKRTGKHPSLPGPAFFHQRQDSGQFLYFAQSLQEVNPNISDILVLGSDRFNGYTNGFGPVCPIATFVICKKHGEDDVNRKLTTLGINGQARDDFMADIFGNERRKELGLIDSRSPEEFDTKLFELEEVWNDRERKSRSTTKPEFLQYFKSYVAKDMKDKMILPVRRRAGLGDNFFYDNATESINHRYKVHLRSAKGDINTQGCRDLQFSLPEAAKVYYQMLQETRRNVHRALIGMGPYRLSPERKALYVAPAQWSQLSQAVKLRHLRKLDKKASVKWLDTPTNCAPTNRSTNSVNTSTTTIQSSDEEALMLGDDDCMITKASTKQVNDLAVNYASTSMPTHCESVSPTTTQAGTGGGALLPEVDDCMVTYCSDNCRRALAHELETLAETRCEGDSENNMDDVLCDFALTGLPEMMKGSWENAKRILQRDGIGPAPGTKNACVVISLTGNNYHTVHLTKGNPDRCDCKRYSETKMCAHSIAVAYKEGTLEGHISRYYVHLSNLAKPASTAGKKPSQMARKRKRAQEDRDVSNYRGRLSTSLPTFPENKKWTVVFVNTTKMRKCYGCGGMVRESTDFNPPSPYDIVLKRKEYRVYKARGTTVLKVAQQEENVYYHPIKQCLLKKNAEVPKECLLVPESTKEKLDVLHKRQLRKEFGILL